MAEQRRFSRFRREPPSKDGFYSQVPQDGLCLSAFLILTEPERRGSVLMGHLKPDAPWARIGALNAERVARFKGGWMLPSSHLIQFEPPLEAARRIAREQLELDSVEFEMPSVFSDAYARDGRKPEQRHWDIGFIYRGLWPAGKSPKSAAWTELRFVDVERTRSSEIARSHGDVLAAIGLPTADSG